MSQHDNSIIEITDKFLSGLFDGQIKEHDEFCCAFSERVRINIQKRVFTVHRDPLVWLNSSLMIIGTSD